jgi:chromosome segregation ATPase
MGFSDLLTSSRGPGVIGTLLALLVLVGFGTLYMFVFDEGLQGGGKKIEAVVRDQGMLIESNKQQLATFKKQIEEGRRLKELEQELTQLEVRTELGAKRLAEATAERDAAQAAADDAKAKWEDYKDAYRQSEWASAEGQEIGELKTLSGRTFAGVIITKVSHIGIEITDQTGKRRIDSADLPLALQDRFQFDEGKKNDAAQTEDRAFQNLSDNVEIANLAKKGQDKLEKIRELTEQSQKAHAGVQDAKSAEPSLLGRADRIRAELAEEQAKAANRAGRRSQGINKTPQIREALRAAESKVSANRNNIRTFERQISTNKRDIAVLEREVETIKGEIVKLKKELAEKQEQQQQPAAAQP